MEVVDTVAAFTSALAAARVRGDVALVPTMGALHAGHASLIERAAEAHRHVAVSIFVNPLQFEHAGDLDGYPRDLDADLAACERAGAATVFTPSAAEMYPRPLATSVRVTGVAEPWEGAARPGHFDGVATVVAKLLAMAGPCAAYFGEKDFQQLCVVRRMVRDLSMPVRIVACSTVRAPDGLALSSRNARLSAAGRQAAAALFRSLTAGARAVAAGEDRPDVVADAMAAVVRGEPLAHLDYAAAVDASDLSIPATLHGIPAVRLLVAALVEGVRLIDNCDGRAEVDPATHSAHACRSGAAPVRCSPAMVAERPRDAVSAAPAQAE